MEKETVTVERKLGEILIVEDSPTQALQLKYSLEKNNYQAYVVNSGKEALDFVKKLKPSIILCDIVMPEMSGFEFCKQIKTNEELKNIPVILLTTLSDPHDIMQGLQCGADNFLTKPCDEQYLLTRIQNLLSNIELRKRSSVEMGIEVAVANKKYNITSDKLQILDLLISTYDSALQKSIELNKAQNELSILNRQLQQQTNELARSNEELEQFAYVASHDLQEPLRMVSSFTQLLANKYKDKLDKEAHEYIHFAVDGAKRMQNLISDLLTYSRVSTEGKEFALTDCTGIFNEATTNLKVAIEESKAVVTQEELPANILADKRLLTQLFQNLIGNAIKYRGDISPKIHVKAKLKDNEYLFSVCDNGIGIDPKDANRIFVIFQRLHTQKEYSGTGIGLAICKKIVERHNGNIYVESELGKGSTFYFTIPNKS